MKTLRRALPACCAAALLLALPFAGGCRTNAGMAPAAGAGETAGPDLANVTAVTLEIRGLSCNLCVAAVTPRLTALPGVTATAADLAAGKITVTLKPGHRLTVTDFVRAVESAGYSCDRLTPGAAGK